jgi:hypothetical protein
VTSSRVARSPSRAFKKSGVSQKNDVIDIGHEKFGELEIDHE